MKLLLLLFALHTLTLSCVPCICNEDCANEKTELPDSKGKKKDNDCTPFCSCSCCYSAVTNIKTTPSIKKLTQLSSKFTFALIDQQFASYNCNNIWQPPKLV